MFSDYYVIVLFTESLPKTQIDTGDLSFELRVRVMIYTFIRIKQYTTGKFLKFKLCVVKLSLCPIAKSVCR